MELVQSPPAPPAPPGASAASGAQGGTGGNPGIPGPSPRTVLQAKEQQREVLGEQLSRLLNRRANVAEQLQNAQLGAPERAALQEHYVALNGRIIDMEKAVQQADVEWATAAGVPGATAQPPRPPRQGGPPEEMLIIGASFAGISMVILSIAFARRLWRGATRVVAEFPAAFEHRFTRLEQSLDAVAIEVERVSEGQRFLTRVFGDQQSRAVGAGAAQPVEAGERIADGVRR